MIIKILKSTLKNKHQKYIDRIKKAAIKENENYIFVDLNSKQWKNFKIKYQSKKITQINIKPKKKCGCH